MLIAWDAGPGRCPPPAAGPQRRVPRVRPPARHARRHGRRHAAVARRRGTAALDRGLHRRVRAAPSRARRRLAAATTAATDPGEFFAVATEVVLRPGPSSCEEAKPELYEVLSRLLPPGPGRPGPPEGRRAVARQGNLARGQDSESSVAPPSISVQWWKNILLFLRAANRAGRHEGADQPGMDGGRARPAPGAGLPVISAIVERKSQEFIHPRELGDPLGGRSARLAQGGAAKMTSSVLDHSEPDDLVWNSAGGRPAPARFWCRRTAAEVVIHRADAEAAAGIETMVDPRRAPRRRDRRAPALPPHPEPRREATCGWPGPSTSTPAT